MQYHPKFYLNMIQDYVLLDAPLHKSNESAVLSVIIPAQGEHLPYNITSTHLQHTCMCPSVYICTFLGSYWNSNSDGHLALLQINCEILGTKRILVDMSGGFTSP